MVKRLIFTAAIMLIPANIFAQDIFKSITFDAACSIAEKEHKTIVIDFYTTWCGPCKQLDKTTWQDKNVIKFFTDSVIGLKVDAEAQADLANRFHIGAYPTIIFVKPNGNEIDRIVGYLDATQFLETAKSTIAGQSVLTYAKEAFEQDKSSIKLGTAYISALIGRGFDKEAVEIYKTLISSNKDSLGIRMSYVNFLFQKKQSREAIAEYKDLIRVSSINKDLLLPYRRMDYARRLVQVEQYKEALEQYLYCYDHGTEENISFFENEHYNLLQVLMVLANKYPPAKQALIDRRNPLQKVVLSGKATTEQVTECISLNNALKDTANALAVFDAVKSQPEIRKMLFKGVIDALLQAKRYSDVLAMAQDPLMEVKNNIKTAYGYIDSIKNDPNMQKELIEDNIREVRTDIINLNSGYYEAALGTNNLTLASQIADNLIGFHNDAETYNVLMECAKHVNAAQQINDLKERADKSLPKNAPSTN